jgi:hypothetical protein
MPKLVGVRERRHQPYWDSIIRVQSDTAPTPTVVSRTRLFNGVNLGVQAWTNMVTAGQFPSDNTYIILAMRCFMHYQGTAAMSMYKQTANQLYLTLFVGDKPQFQAPAWFFPQGGGIWGYDSTTPFATNGLPTTEAILKLAKPIPVPARQNFYVEASFEDVGTVSVMTNYLNSSTSVGSRELKVVLDGIHTRDVL